MAIVINLDVMLAKRKMSVTELSRQLDISLANVSILKNGRAKAVKLGTLDKLCRILECQPGDILEYQPDGAYGEDLDSIGDMIEEGTKNG